MAGNQTKNKSVNSGKQEKEFYKKYRWFFTNSGKLVYGGKSAEQNEEVVHKLITSSKYEGEENNYILMHTQIPGSPFAVIFASPESVNESDLEETAIWTGCFSRAWREKLKKVEVDVFRKNEVYKKKSMAKGTFGVKKKLDRKQVRLELILINQKETLRAVPEKTLKTGQKILSKFQPGDLPKEEFAERLLKKLNLNKKKKEEILNALPTGGFKEIKR